MSSYSVLALSFVCLSACACFYWAGFEHGAKRALKRAEEHAMNALREQGVIYARARREREEREDPR